jgi:uncharacterized protein (TIGR02284 family)
MLTENKDELIEVLNDLVRINNDRIEGYERAIEKSADRDRELVDVFTRMIEESRQYKGELLELVQSLGGRSEWDETTASGKLYRFWMNIKGTLGAKDSESVLDDCEFGEDAAQKAYQEALESDATMGADVRKLIVNQKTSLKNSHDIIKRMRDAQREFSEAQGKKQTRS